MKTINLNDLALEYDQAPDGAEFDPQHPIFQMAEEIDRLRAELDTVHSEARTLAVSMHRDFYSDEAPEWEPLPSAAGLLSQIDNMYSGLRERLQASKTELDQLKQWRGTLRYTSDGALAECPCCGSLDVGAAGATVNCYRCGLTITKFSHQEALAAWNRREGRGQGDAVYLVWSNDHNCYWRPNRAGYTRSTEDAGRYTYAEADSICRNASPRSGSNLDDDVPPEIMVLAPECAPPAPAAVPDDLMRRIKDLLVGVGHHGVVITDEGQAYEIGEQEVAEAQELYGMLNAAPQPEYSEK